MAMPAVELLIGGLVAVLLLTGIASALAIPRAVVMLLGGLALGFVPGTPDVRLEPDLIFLVFLPPILYAAAFTFATEDVRANLRPIGLLAIGLVLATVGGIAVAGHLVIGLDWGPAFVLGAIVAPTDPVAATAVIRRAGAPSQIATILEGEALVNDGSALTVLRVAIAAVGASFEIGPALVEFIWVVAAGIAIGIGVGFAGRWLRKRIDQPTLEITLALATAYGAFFAADQVDVSGILATVAAGAVMGARPAELGTAEARLQSGGFWEVAVFLSESLLFLLIGLEFQDVLGNLGDRTVPDLAGYLALVVAVVMGLRLLWMFTVPYVSALVDPQVSGTRTRTSWRERLVLSLSGMRGAVTVAAALSIPISAAGEPFPDRGLLIFLAYGCVIATLAIPALTLSPLIRRLGLAQPAEARQQALDARLAVAHAALARAEELAKRDGMSEEALDRAREAYEMRVHRIESEIDEATPGPSRARGLAHDYAEIRRELLDAERDELARLRSDRAVPGETLREIERELDLEQARLPGSR
jgi:CPA1 family monovalent cation:H+ antiporter